MVDRNEMTAARRARWLATLSNALDDAQRLLARLVQVQRSNPQTMMLQLHVASLRQQVDLLQLGGPAALRIADPTLSDNDGGLEPMWRDHLP